MNASGNQFNIPHFAIVSEAWLDSLPDPGQEAEYRLRQQAWRESPGPEFLRKYGKVFVDEETGWEGVEEWEVCPIDGSTNVVSDSINDYGGTSSGWTICNTCGYTKSWSDLSAII